MGCAGVDLQEDEVNSDGEITKGRKRRELQRRMKKAGRRPDNREESRLRHVGLLCRPVLHNMLLTNLLGLPVHTRKCI